MMLRLSIENVPSLASGDPVEVSLHEHGMVIGRAAHADWTLPDPNNHVSSIHCEVDYRDGRYFLTDRSTNGTFINGAANRPQKPVQLRDGDLLQIGHYQIRIEEVPEGGGAGGRSDGSAAGAAFGAGIDWGNGTEAAAKPISKNAFGREAVRPMFQSSQDPLMGAFAPPLPAAARTDPFGVAPGSAPSPAPFGSSSGGDPFGIASPTAPAVPAHPPASSGDPFGIAAGGTAPEAADPFGAVPAAAPVGRADPFGTPAARERGDDPFGMADQAFAPAQTPAFAPIAAPTSAPVAAGDPWAMLGAAGAVDFSTTPGGATAATQTPMPVASPVAPAPPLPAPPEPTLPEIVAPAAHLVSVEPHMTVAGDADLYARLLAATGLEARDMGARAPESVVDTIGQLLRQTADGLFRLLEARTRVRHQFGVGAQVTTFQRAGNNPLKWTRSPEQALKQMIGEPDRGFLEGAQAVRGAFEDLQAHEMAMIAAMQEAMQETIRRFAPDTIRTRIGARGWLKSVLPGSREATLWRAYESEFSAFADESEAAYLDLFAKQFRKAYERIVSADQG